MSSIRDRLRRLSERVGLSAAFRTTQPPSADPSCSIGVRAALTVGDIVADRYEVTEVFTAGAMGEVVRVDDKRRGTSYVMKRPRAELLETDEQRETFVRECRIWSSLSGHPNIVEYDSVRIVDGQPVVLAEYIPGGSLQDAIRAGTLYDGSVTDCLRRILRIAADTACALEYAHACGVVHQDMKPANVLLLPDWTAKIGDFGVAAAVRVARETDDPRLASEAPFSGFTPKYGSPEQANEATTTVTAATDVWSWGLTVLAMFSEGPNWASGASAAEALAEHIRQGAGVRAPAVPKGLAKLLRRCFQADGKDRLTSFGPVCDALHAVYRKECGHTYVAARGPRRPTKKVAARLNREAATFSAETQLGECFPPRIGEWAKSDDTVVLGSLEQAGIVVKYRRGESAHLSIYVYGSIRYGGMHSVKSQLWDAREYAECDLQNVCSQKHPGYEWLSDFVRTQYPAESPSDDVSWLVSTFFHGDHDSPGVKSWICISSWQRRVLKVRVTCVPSESMQFTKNVHRFLNDLRDALGGWQVCDEGIDVGAIASSRWDDDRGGGLFRTFADQGSLWFDICRAPNSFNVVFAVGRLGRWLGEFGQDTAERVAERVVALSGAEPDEVVELTRSVGELCRGEHLTGHIAPNGTVKHLDRWMDPAVRQVE